MEEEENLSCQWAQRFLLRHLTFRSTIRKPMYAARSKLYTQDKINGFFNYLQGLLNKNNRSLGSGIEEERSKMQYIM